MATHAPTRENQAEAFFAGVIGESLLVPFCGTRRGDNSFIFNAPIVRNHIAYAAPKALMHAGEKIM